MAIFKDGHRNGVHRRGSKVEGYSFSAYERRQTVEITITVKHKSDKAWLCTDGVTEGWIPVSQMREVEQPPVTSRFDMQNGAVVIGIPHWLAKEKGFIK